MQNLHTSNESVKVKKWHGHWISTQRCVYVFIVTIKQQIAYLIYLRKIVSITN